jgi:2-polyprenyl-3-methyl-5-hydroxy-6-metoxy-1,4-benzoquinol methylase
MKRTGHIERFVPGDVAGPVAEAHLARYGTACRLVAGKRVGDIACGAGYGSRMLAEAGAASVIGIDNCVDALREAAGRYPHRQVRYLAADATTLPLAAGSLDLVVSFETIEHLREPARFLGEVRRVLRPGGLLLLSTPNREVTRLGIPRYWRRRPSNPFHVREFTRPEIYQMLRRCGFAVEEESGQYFLPSRYTGLPTLLAIVAREALLRDGRRKRIYDVENTQPSQVRAIPADEVPLFLLLRCRRQ